ncbi:hypothetical protein BDY19DRAFT_907312 [Irpex rosettiformis]|uniref:Uncharacterized protein n=1 Tax=Irpex rosettiformis TaxID=378272 RepID=A0ACB8U1M1_9APHY|nr:hypothetical protein BDY19DRAFT_907312 [Irpex rosettiformis]
MVDEQMKGGLYETVRRRLRGAGQARGFPDSVKVASSTSTTMSTLFQPGTYDAKIQATVEDLNVLLCNLSIPVTLESLLDLTPSLLVIILELMLQHRLPISQAIRTAKDIESKVQAMDVFVELLLDVVGRENKALNEVDPRMLAIGEWGEIVTVAEALVTVGRASGLVSQSSLSSPKKNPRTQSNDSTRAMSVLYKTQDDSIDPFWVPLQDERSLPRSPTKTTRSTGPFERPSSQGLTSIVSDVFGNSLSSSRLSGPANASFTTTVLPHSPESSLSSIQSDDRSHNTGSSSRSRQTASSSTSTRSAPRCIHEVKGPEEELSRSFDASMSLTDTSICDCSIHSSTHKSSTKNTPVRYSGWIEPVDDEEEIRSFEARRRSRVEGPRLALLRTPRTSMPEYGGLSLGSTMKTPGSTPGRDPTRTLPVWLLQIYSVLVALTAQGYISQASLMMLSTILSFEMVSNVSIGWDDLS